MITQYLKKQQGNITIDLTSAFMGWMDCSFTGNLIQNTLDQELLDILTEHNLITTNTDNTTTITVPSAWYSKNLRGILLGKTELHADAEELGEWLITIKDDIIEISEDCDENTGKLILKVRNAQAEMQGIARDICHDVLEHNDSNTILACADFIGEGIADDYTIEEARKILEEP